MTNQTQQDTKKEVRSFLNKYIKEKSFTDDTNIFAEGFVNSLFAMDLIVFIEKNYLFKIANEDLNIANFKSVNAITNLIIDKIDHANQV